MAKHHHQPDLEDWQPKPGADKRFALKHLDPAATPWSSGDKDQDRDRLEKLALQLDELQNLFYADRRHALLVVLQGVDTSGKDGTIRAVFSRTSPLGMRTVAWKAPSEVERAHDYLWRIHRAAPGKGEIVIFNRSHYEDVLVPVVNGDITHAQTERRYGHINDFERMLTDNGTVILKFMLHISFEEQRKRLQARIDDPTKRWKFDPGDLKVREQWDGYRKAFESLLAITSTPWAPWTVVPADSKGHRNLMVASLVCDALRKLKLRYPPDPPGVKGLKVH